ncbi:hypothetical protein EUGRSUZ_I02008 [Eucalyptus grandis]|uniref:Uncharacterized protein n=2 Tax=Eucalyptus grandis TaxID=71139 RepID=A0ACC3JHQ1_EUCGR|nr:hypothetical protein EUGRSUZ_I02008 [Eucalyptus grandis]
MCFGFGSFQHARFTIRNIQRNETQRSGHHHSFYLDTFYAILVVSHEKTTLNLNRTTHGRSPKQCTQPTHINVQIARDSLDSPHIMEQIAFVECTRLICSNPTTW